MRQLPEWAPDISLHCSRSAHRLGDATESAPTIFIVPCNGDSISPNSAPPSLEFFARQVKRGWGDEVIKNYCVLFAPAKRRQISKILVIEQVASDRLSG